MDAEKVLKAIGERILEESKFKDDEGYIRETNLTALSHLVDSYTTLYDLIRK
jgi:hypothetical protein